MHIASFGTDVTDARWHFSNRCCPPPSRATVRARRCVWWLRPPGFPPGPTVYHHFRPWSRDHAWSNLNDRLRAQIRAPVDKRPRPTAAVLDSQTVRSGPYGGTVGYDMAKETRGRKRFLLVDTLGLRLGARTFLEPLRPVFTWLRRLWVDGGFSGPDVAAWVRAWRRKLKVEASNARREPADLKCCPGAG